MRPPPKAGENDVERLLRVSGVNVASMRPPPKAGENRLRGGWSKGASNRFNEAPAESGGKPERDPIAPDQLILLQ